MPIFHPLEIPCKQHMYRLLLDSYTCDGGWHLSPQVEITP